ncbi:Planctomycete cytochrome C [Anatilimnocola aggregata]|uniref:Planctomycete cytochrome C n=1 Tax=Anatilimnocola aggregata TaxID=2528021 RepID=A0A517YG56_9BACT|nr:DUF1592 domain-containing protein [Anatilimnocola aggregata]QDU29215.1 Planctomycete cytochrome C [Anatilimnocola aggregata]
MRLGFLIALLSLSGFSIATAQESGNSSAKPDLTKDLFAYVNKNCLHCHGEKEGKADVRLHSYKDELSIVKGRKVWEHVVDMVEAGEMPPKDKPQPMASDTTAFLAAVKGVFLRADQNAKPDPGRVTVRRLNRTEYNNTIRDLVGVDFNAAEDFPSDDVGHGFDNIGDVLTLSPVLMERYLAAAEGIMKRAIVVEVPKSPTRWQGGQYLEPAGGNVPKQKWRPISAKDETAQFTGPLHTQYQNLPPGEYQFRVRTYATTEGKEPVKVVVLAVGKELAEPDPVDRGANIVGGTKAFRSFKILKEFTVDAREDKKAQNLELDFTMPQGMDRMAVGLLKAADGEPLQTLHVENFALTGPKDMRPATQLKLLRCSPEKPQAEQTREVLLRFASRAYRRPATTAEVDRLCQLAEAALASGEKWEGAMQFAMQAVLVSPKFLFRLELDDRPQAAESRALDEFQLASRLSYFIWSSMPDDELFRLALKGQLSANLEPQVRRMLKDPRSVALYKNFAVQWLQLGRLQMHSPDKTLFKDFNDSLRQDMLRETELFFLAIVQEDRSILDLINADFTYLNERLGNHYGILDDTGTTWATKKNRPNRPKLPREEFVRVQLADDQRGGLLTMASVLTVTSNPTRTSPVKRGRWVLEQILGTPPPPPPPDVPELKESAELKGTLRERMAQHMANPACANCHAKMDPIGFAFENFDAVGKYRWEEEKQKIDPAGTLPDGQSFAGPAELKKIIQSKKELFGRNLAEKMLTYGLGRGLEYYDRPTIQKIVGGLAADDYKFSRLVIEIAKSEPFRNRRGKDPAK